MRTSSANPTPGEAPRGAWNRFWFMPTDPTTLGFMRIMTGLIVIYVHLAYAFDLQAFFGPDGFWDRRTADLERAQAPVYVHDWFDEEEKHPDDFPKTISTPQVLDRRIAVFDFLKHLPEDKKKRDEGLQFLYFMLDQSPKGRPPLSDAAFEQSLRLLKNAGPLLEEDRIRIDAELRNDDLNESRLPLTLPTYFMQMSPPDRLRAWQDVMRFMEYLPGPEGNFVYVLGWLEELSPMERGTLVKFLRKLPDGPKAREKIEYIQVWRQDEETVFTKGRFVFSVWFHVSSPTTMWVLHFLFIGVFVLFTIGLWTRVASVLSWMAALFYIHRTQQVLFGMDTMMNVLLFYLMIGPSGAALSVDRLLERYRASRAILAAGRQSVPWAEASLAGPRPSAMANFAVRLVQIHFCYIYAASGLAKLKGTTWWDTSAAWSTIANPEFCPPLQYPLYEKFLYQLACFKPALGLVMFFTVYFTLLLEISLPYLIWTRLRPLLVCCAIVLHSAIAWVMGLTCFGLLMMTLLLSYIPAAAVRERLGWGPGSGPPIAVRFNPRDRRQLRAISLLRALDLGSQIRPQAEEAANRDTPLVLVGPDQQSWTDGDAVVQGIRMLSFGKSLAWILWVPGVSALIQRFAGHFSKDGDLANDSATTAKTPVAR